MSTKAKPWPINHLPSIGERLRTQDNRCTSQPMFCVQVRRRIYGMDPDYSEGTCWVEDGEEISKADKGREARKVGFIDRWETVMVAFTEAGAEDYIRQNGHNHHGEKRIYVQSFRRCDEMVAIRKMLMEPPQG